MKCRRVMRFYITTSPPGSSEAFNLDKLAQHYNTWHTQVLEMGRVPDTTLEARIAAGKLVTAAELLRWGATT